mgnify:CR=1 FL=1
MGIPYMYVFARKHKHKHLGLHKHMWHTWFGFGGLQTYIYVDQSKFSYWVSLHDDLRIYFLYMIIYFRLILTKQSMGTLWGGISRCRRNPLRWEQSDSEGACHRCQEVVRGLQNSKWKPDHEAIASGNEWKEQGREERSQEGGIKPLCFLYHHRRGHHVFSTFITFSSCLPT